MKRTRTIRAWAVVDIRGRIQSVWVRNEDAFADLKPCGIYYKGNPPRRVVLLTGTVGKKGSTS